MTYRVSQRNHFAGFRFLIAILSKLSKQQRVQDMSLLYQEFTLMSKAVSGSKSR